MGTAKRRHRGGSGCRMEEEIDAAGATAPTEDVARSDIIYSMPPLYDLAFRYRSYTDKVVFLPVTHMS